MELSNRLAAVAGFVQEGASVADIGTDHGYIPIYLVEQKIADRVIAADIHQGPLQRADMHVAGCGLSGRIETRLSDGLKGFQAGEIDTMIAAGMGGGLIIRILDEGRAVVDSLEACILQPQSEIGKVRKYLALHGLVIEREDMVEEDGKFYPVMRVVHGEPENYEEYEFIYGKRLLQMRHPVLKNYLLRECRLKETIIRQLHSHTESEGARVRLEQLNREAEYVRQALACYAQSMSREEETVWCAGKL